MAAGLHVALSAGPAVASALPRVTLLATGGTIAGRGETPTAAGYTAAAVNVDALLGGLPELATIAQITGLQVLQVASQAMTPTDWIALGRRADAVLADPLVDGVVITHGTDTLEETAYFLSLTLHSPKPVVIVGAMRPVTQLSADGPFNLYEAVQVAGDAAAGHRGVLVLLDDQVHAARDVTKANTSMTDAFHSPGLGALGLMTPGGVLFYRTPTRRHTAHSRFDIRTLDALPQVEIAMAYAGASGAAIDALVEAGARGLVIAGVGNGNVGHEVGLAVQRARHRGVAVVRSSRVGSGQVGRNHEVDDDAWGTVVADTLNPQKARVLLMLGLSQRLDTPSLQRLFDTY